MTPVAYGLLKFVLVAGGLLFAFALIAMCVAFVSDLFTNKLIRASEERIIYDDIFDEEDDYSPD